MHTGLVEKLTERQRSCLSLVAELKKTEQIAAELGISPSTVNTHIERALALLGTSSRREAAKLVIAYDGGRGEKSPTEYPRLVEPAVISPPPALATSATGRNRNDLSWSTRLAWAVLALAVLCFAIGALGAAIEQLSKWRASFVHGRPAPVTRSDAGWR